MGTFHKTRFITYKAIRRQMAVTMRGNQHTANVLSFHAQRIHVCIYIYATHTCTHTMYTCMWFYTPGLKCMQAPANK